MKKVFVFFILFPVLFSEAQFPVSMGGNQSPALDSAANLYFTSRGQSSVIYNGRIFYGYPGIIGDAFYPSDGWQKGSLLYDGTWYHTISMRFDIHKGQLVVRHPNNISICLVNERVQKFFYDGQIFVRLNPDPDNVLNTGFYHALKDGKYYLVKKQKTLLNLLKDQKQNVIKHLKKENLKYKHDPEKTIMAIADYYNQL
jgi:hypothetical protein